MATGLAPWAAAPASAAVPTTTATLVRTVATSALSPALPDPAGIVYLPGRDSFLISDSEVDETPVFEGANVLETTRSGAVLDRGLTTAYTKEAAGIGHDPTSGHAFVSDDDQFRVHEIDPGADGRYGTADDTRTWFSTAAFGSTDPEDVTYFPPTGELFVLDGADHDVHRVDPGPNGRFDGVAPTGDDTATELDVEVYGAEDPEGIGYHPGRGTLVVVDSTSEAVYELNRQLMLVSRVDIAVTGQVFAAGITVAPATDDPGRYDLYVVDRGVDNDTDPDENDGRLFELRVDLPPIVNLAPVVDAGRDAPVVVGEPLDLQATVRDDGRPGPTTTLTWTNASGPGSITFADATSSRTTARFSAAGTYVVRATSSDGALTGADELIVTVVAAGAPLPLDTPVAKAFDDVEQRPTGYADWLGSSLNIPRAGTMSQTIGIRFDELAVPVGATITEAWIQFRASGSNSDAASIQVTGVAEDDTPTFTTSGTTVSSRPRTQATATWAPPAWKSGQTTSAQRTTDLRAIVQEVVRRPGWRAGNALAFVMTGTGERRASSHDGVAAPVLHLAYTTATTEPPPTSTPIAFRGLARTMTNATSASVTTPASVRAGDAMLLFATVNDTATTITPPPGWTQRSNVVAGSQRTLLWQRVATSTDAGRSVTVGLSSYVKVGLHLAAYGATSTSDPVLTVSSASETVGSTSHTTPTVSVAGEGQWVVSYWADKSSATTDWRPPGGVVVRDELVGTGGGHVGVLLADSGGPVSPGTRGGLTAMTDATSRAATISVVLRAG
ncbi:PKD domain-containing protein [Nocardioides sp.]|uniref:PKD domain-containing protein n=1 Tax=Nocardioides sp. TaxID=35761 RepID=UPI00286BD6B5|nr:hypothetical protein [Nocardioides sp.]